MILFKPPERAGSFMLEDFSYAFRMLRKTPGFTLVAVLSLALGTGADSALLRFVDALLLRPQAVERAGAVLMNSGVAKASNDPFSNISYREYLDFRAHAKTMEDFVVVSIFRVGYSLSPAELPKVKYGLLVSGNLFQAM